MSGTRIELTVFGITVGQDDRGNICLNDLWVLAGKPDNQRAKDWRRYRGTEALMEALTERIVCDTHNSPEAVQSAIYYSTGKGQAAKTFAHPVLALSYAEILNPTIGVEVREVFLRYRGNDVLLAQHILEQMTEQQEYDTLRVKLREQVKAHNKLSAGAAKAAGVKNFEAYNGAGLGGLYGGMTKADLLNHKGLPPDAHHLDHAGHEELAANYFKATQAVAKLARDGISGQRAANEAHREVGEVVRGAIKSIGGTMPEDEPALDHIKKAQKRLKAAPPSEPKPLPKMKRKAG